MNKKISIIIPCFNAEHYIYPCFKSLYAQTTGIENLEIIFIDDASTDSTWNILQEIERAYPDNITIIHCEENRKQGCARNIGLNNSSSDYIAFMDVDDLAEPSMYEMLYVNAVKYNCDIVCCKYIRNYKGQTETLSPFIPNPSPNNRLLLIDSVEKRKQFILAGSLSSVPWNKLIKRDFLLQHEIYFPEQYYYEDHYWGSLIYLYACRVYLLDEKLYHYCMNPNSVVLYRNQPYYEDMLTVNLIKWQEWQFRNLLDTYYNELVYDLLSTCYIGYLKVLILRMDTPSLDAFLELKNEIRSRIGDYTNNPNIKSHFTPFNQLLLKMLNMNVTQEIFTKITLQAKIYWLRVNIFTSPLLTSSLPDDIYHVSPIRQIHSDKLVRHSGVSYNNISHLRMSSRSLEELYWIWQNHYTSDYIGQCPDQIYFIDNKSQEALTKAMYIEILSEYDIIISSPILLKKSCNETYSKLCKYNILDTVRETLSIFFPEYLYYYEEVLYGNKTYFNMLVTSKPLLDTYAKWLFHIYEILSTYKSSNEYFRHNSPEALSSLLLITWINRNQLIYFECPIYKPDHNLM